MFRGPLKLAERWRPVERLLHERRAGDVEALAREAAEGGDADAQVLMGERGYYGPPSLPSSEVDPWFDLAAAQGQSDAMARLAMRSTAWDRDLLLRAAEAGSSIAQHAVAHCCSRGMHGFRTSWQRATAFYVLAAESGNVEAMYAYGEALSIGPVRRRNGPESVRWLEKAAMAEPAGHASVSAAQWLGFAAIRAGIEVDPETRRRWHERFEEIRPDWILRDPERRLAEALAELGGPDDLPSIAAAGRRWDPQAARVMAIAHHVGMLGAALDPPVARAWWRRASEGRNVPAMAEYGAMLVYGDEYRRDRVEGLKWLERAATASPGHLVGSVEAAGTLARIYRRGLGGVRPDAVAATSWQTRRDALASTPRP